MENQRLESDQILHGKFVEYGKNAKEWMRKCIILLPEIEKRQIWRQKGFSSIYEYAAKLAGMSYRTINDALRIMAKTEDKPALRKVIEERGIWAVRPVIAIATKDNEKELAEKSRIMSRSTLATYVRESLRACPPIDSEKNLVPINFNKPDVTQKVIFSMVLSPEVAFELEKLKGDDWDETIAELLRLRREKLQEEKPESVKAGSRAVPTAIERYILKRSNCRCEFSNCTKKYEALHHGDRFSITKIHDPDRIFALCKEHHDLAHRGLIEGEAGDIRFWKIRKEPDKIDLKYMIDQRVMQYSAVF